MVRPRNRNEIWLWTGLGVFSVLALPAACVYPDYTFNEQEAAASGSTSGSGGASSSSSSSSSTSGSSQGGGGASSSSSSAMSSVTSGSGGATAESCLNTTDDDGDGLVDCADPDCNAGYACVPAAPIGWNNGYVLLFVGTPGQEPNCPAEFPSSSPYTGINGISFTAPTCDACTCDSPTGQTCDPPDKITVSNKVCGQLPTQPRDLPVPPAWTGSCYGPSGYAGGDLSCGGPCNISVNAAAPTVLGGSCAPQGGTPTISPVNWNAAAKGCGDAPSGGGCAAAEVCQPHPPGEPFLTGLCVFKDGDNICPSGPFTDRHLFYQNVMDTRDCTACQCGAPSGSTCNVSISVYSDVAVNVCNTSTVTFNAGSCGNLVNNPAVIGRTATITPPSGGSCPASGGQPTGTVTPILPTTFCCIP